MIVSRRINVTNAFEQIGNFFHPAVYQVHDQEAEQNKPGFSRLIVGRFSTQACAFTVFAYRSVDRVTARNHGKRTAVHIPE